MTVSTSGVALLRPQWVVSLGSSQEVQMSGPEEVGGWKSAARGESAWKEERDQVATRNEAAQKAGKLERAEYVRGREAARHAEEARRQASLIGRRRTP